MSHLPLFGLLLSIERQLLLLLSLRLHDQLLHYSISVTIVTDFVRDVACNSSFVSLVTSLRHKLFELGHLLEDNLKLSMDVSDGALANDGSLVVGL